MKQVKYKAKAKAHKKTTANNDQDRNRPQRGDAWCIRRPPTLPILSGPRSSSPLPPRVPGGDAAAGGGARRARPLGFPPTNWCPPRRAVQHPRECNVAFSYFLKFIIFTSGVFLSLSIQQSHHPLGCLVSHVDVSMLVIYPPFKGKSSVNKGIIKLPTS